ncbi:MAG: PEPxxWA-CTERM sorting domain-containing protein [Pseudomonadota bacterium]
MRTKLLYSAAALAFTIATPAFAGHVVIYGPRTEASTYSATHQGPNVVGSTSHWVNGVMDAGGTSVGNAGSSTGGGSTAQTYAQTIQDGGAGSNALHNDAYAAANLTNGTLKATTASTGPNNFGTPMGIASARLDDTIFFNNTSGSTQTISFTYRFDGQLYDPVGGNPGGNVSLALSCGGNLGGCYNGPNGTGQTIMFAKADGSLALLPNNSSVTPFDTNWNYYFGMTSSCFGENIYCGQYSSNLWDYGLNAPNAGGVVDGYIRAYLNIPTGLTSLGISGILNLDCRGGSSCDFGNTGKFGFGNLPTGLTYSSASGAFLTATTPPTNPPGAVPEPATWAMMIAGFGFIGGTMRVRRRTMSFA